MRPFPLARRVALASFAGLVLPLSGRAQTNFDTVQVRSEKLTDRLHVLFGAGGNIALSIGNDGAFIVDDQFAPLSEKITRAIAVLTDRPLRFVVNTHWHGDHTGGNANFGRAGALILAQDNVRKRMSTEQVRGNNRTPPSPPEALPVVTFPEQIHLYVNGDSVHAIWVPNAHTDGDAIIHYPAANAIHMGDTYMTGRFPFIDVASGGSIDGLVAAAERALAIARDDTRIIPGHGSISSKAALREYGRMLATVRDRVKALVAQGKSLTEVAAAKPLADVDPSWGRGFINADAFLDVVYNDLKAKYGRK